MLRAQKGWLMAVRRGGSANMVGGTVAVKQLDMSSSYLELISCVKFGGLAS